MRAAVVGVGHLGRFHAQKYPLIDGVQLTGVFDANYERAKEVAAELGVSAFKSLVEVIENADAVTVASSTESHFEIAKALLKAGVHCLVEKPLTVRVAEARELCELAESKGLCLQVGHVERFNPALLSVREKLKDPLFIQCDRLAPFKPRSVGVDVVLDLMIHDLDVILSLVKSDWVDVKAVGTPVLTGLNDIANARIEFASGAVANVTSSRVSQKTQRKFRVFQSDQYLSIDFGSGEVNLLTKTGELTEDEIPIEMDAWSLEKGDALLLETEAFVRSVRGEQAVTVSGRDGLRALLLAETVLKEIDKKNTQKKKG